MKNSNIFYIFVLCVCFLISIIDFSTAKAIQRAEDEKYRSSGDILSRMAETPLKPIVPLLAEVPIQIGKIEEPFVDQLFPELKQFADEVSVFPVLPFSKQLPEPIQEKMATMQIEPIFLAFETNPLLREPILFMRPLIDPILNPLKPLLDELLQLLISLVLKTFILGGK